MIIGDGIHESVEEMVDFLNQTPNMLFSLALIELQLFKLNEDKEYLVIPQIVTRTREITRAVVKIEGTSIDKVQVTVDTANENNKDNKKKRFTLSEQDFYDELSKSINNSYISIIRDLFMQMDKLGCIIQWRQSSAMVKYLDPNGSKQKLTFFGIYTTGNVFVGWLPEQLNRIGLDNAIADDFYSKSERLFENGDWSTSIKFEEIKNNMKEFINLLETLINKINEGAR